jgi:hypothetical protein
MTTPKSPVENKARSRQDLGTHPLLMPDYCHCNQIPHALLAVQFLS